MQIKQSSADVKRGGEIDEKAGFWNCRRGNVGVDGGGCNNSIDSLDITHHTIAEETSHERTGRLTATYHVYTFIPDSNYGKYYDVYGNWYDSLYEIPNGYDYWSYTYPGDLSWQTASVSDDYAKVRWTTSNTGDYDSDTKDYEISFANDTIPYAFDIHKTGSKYYTDNHQSVSMSGSLESSFSISGSVYFGDGTTLSSLILELIGYGDYFSYEIDRLRDNPTSYMPYFTNIRFERY